ncbi:NUDIX domain-containing protein, partial [Candidatus Roizmanbacteria bacterium]|nr:NUDIX domain-containing protein [Candidatus Roizmanbacteria bacterium]
IRYPEPIVGLFIFNPKGELLLIKTHKWKGDYSVPGGHIEWGETILDALKREAKEETNLDVVHPQFLCMFEYISDGTFYKQKHMLFLNHRVETASTDVVLNHEAEGYVWITPSDALKTLPIEKYAKTTIEQYLLVPISSQA